MQLVSRNEAHTFPETSPVTLWPSKVNGQQELESRLPSHGRLVNRQTEHAAGQHHCTLPLSGTLR